MDKNKKLDNVVTEFNSTMVDFAKNIANIFPNSLIGNNLNLIISILNSKEHATKHKIMHIFICKVLPYKSKIDEGDETFFLNKSFNDDTDDTSILDNVFEIKSLWKILNEQNKKYVVQYMQLLCEIAQEYFSIYSN